MDMKLEEVAKLLNVGKEKITRWIQEGDLPAYEINQEYRFNREQVEKWMIDHIGETTPSNAHHYSLCRALHKGEIYQEIPGSSKSMIIRETMKQMASGYNLDSEVLTDLLLDRETLMPTAINNGIAVPHTRDFLLNHHFDVVTIVYPEKPLDYGALDGLAVHTLFFLFACEDTRHLDLLGKIAHFCSKEENLDLLKSRPNKKTLLAYVKNWEESLTS